MKKESLTEYFDNQALSLKKTRPHRGMDALEYSRLMNNWNNIVRRTAVNISKLCSKEALPFNVVEWYKLTGYDYNRSKS